MFVKEVAEVTSLIVDSILLNHFFEWHNSVHYLHTFSGPPKSVIEFLEKG